MLNRIRVVILVLTFIFWDDFIWEWIFSVCYSDWITLGFMPMSQTIVVVLVPNEVLVCQSQIS